MSEHKELVKIDLTQWVLDNAETFNTPEGTVQAVDIEILLTKLTEQGSTKPDTDAGDLELLLHHLTHYCNGYDIYYLENAMTKKDELERVMNKLKNLAELQGSTDEAAASE